MNIKPLAFTRAYYPRCLACLEESTSSTPWGQRLGVRKRGTGKANVFVFEWWLDWTDNYNEDRKYRTWHECQSMDDGEQQVQAWYVKMVQECLERLS